MVPDVTQPELPSVAATRSLGGSTMRALAWLSVVVTIAMLVGSLLLADQAAAGDAWLLNGNELALLHPLISGLVGALVIDRRGSYVVGWLFCLSALGWGLGYLGGAAGVYRLAGGTLAGQDLLIWCIVWAPFLAFALAPVWVVYVFPTGRLTTPRWRWFMAFTVAVTFLGTVGYMVVPGPIEDLPALDNPFGVGGVGGTLAGAARDLYWPLLLIGIAAGVVSLRQRMRAAPFEQRQQIKWLLLAGAVLVGFVSFWGVVDTLGHPDAAAVLSGLFLPTFPIALGIAILRHRLYDIDVLLNRTLVYLSLSAVLGAVYLGAVFLLQRVLSPVTEDSNIAIAASTLAVAALFRPLRASIQRFIDRRFYREKYSAIATLERFSTRLRNELDIDALEGELLVVIDQTLHPATAMVWLRSAEL